MKARSPSPLYRRIREILESARANVARSVNTTQVVANWLIGREIVVEEQQGQKRAGYGERLIVDLSARLKTEYGGGFAVRNLASFREFYLGYPSLSWTHYRTLLRVDKAEARAFYEIEAGAKQKKIFASRYELHLPTEAELKAEIRRELRELKA